MDINNENAKVIDKYRQHILYMYTLLDLLGDTSNELYNAVRCRLYKKSYALNLQEYEKNPFFLGYTSYYEKGILVNGKLLIYKDVAKTTRE